MESVATTGDEPRETTKHRFWWLSQLQRGS